MRKLLGRVLLVTYQVLPEWLIRNLVFFLIGFVLASSFVFLAMRPTFRKARSMVRRLRNWLCD